MRIRADDKLACPVEMQGTYQKGDPVETRRQGDKKVSCHDKPFARSRGPSRRETTRFLLPTRSMRTQHISGRVRKDCAMGFSLEDSL